MKRISGFIISILVFLPFQLYGQGEPLRVAIQAFAPPFVMQGGNDQLYGFDVNLINTVCQKLNRTCQFQIMNFHEILDAVESRRADVGISAITITIPRSRRVNFSIPYLPSFSRFLTTEKFSKQPFTLQTLNNKEIGIEEGSIFKNQIIDMGIRNSNIQTYVIMQEMIDALQNGQIDFALLDNASAIFWAVQASGVLKTFGEPSRYGLGFGIAVNMQNRALLEQINEVLLAYQNSDDFKKNYNQYLGHL